MPGSPEPDHVRGEERVCAVCAVPLNWGSLTGWIHPTSLVEFDHIVVPVGMDELASIEWRCDFCNAPARWALPANTFPTPADDYSVGDWCICDACKPAVEKRQWLKIVDRVQAAFLANGRSWDSGHTLYMLRLYERLENNITGPIYLNPPTARKESP